MKIRTDFVTNSSSSSFILEVAINYEDDKKVSLSIGADDDCSEGYSEITVYGGPARIAQSKNIEELWKAILRSIDTKYYYMSEDLLEEPDPDDYEDEEEYEEAAAKYYEYYESTEDDGELWKVLPMTEGMEFKKFDKEIKEIEDVEKITSIMMKCSEYYMSGDSYKKVFYFNRKTKRGYVCEYGEEQEELNGAKGGRISFSDKEYKKLSYEESDLISEEIDKEQIKEELKEIVDSYGGSTHNVEELAEDIFEFTKFAKN